MTRIIVILGLFALATLTAGASQEGVAGMWNDGLVAENTGLYIAPDGTGDLISERCYGLIWSFDPSAKIITIKLRADQKESEKILRFRFDLAQDQLVALDKLRGDKDWTFKRRGQEEIERWLAVKKKNEDEQKEANQVSEPKACRCGASLRFGGR